MATIRHAVPDDARAIAAIWNPMIRDTAVTFDATEKSPAEIAGLIAARGEGFLVAETDGVVGFATFAPFRGGAGYARTLEHSIHLAAQARRSGLGRRLFETLRGLARTQGAHVLVAAISASNAPGLAFHAALGFETVGRLPEVGRKFGRWHDLVLMQLRL